MASPSKRRLVNLLRTLWVLVIVWYEYGTFISSVKDCNWPSESGVSSPADATPGEVKQRPHHVLLVADPQIVDKYSYPGRGIILSYFTRLIVDLNLRKNWQAALRKRPDTVVFLGDMMDNGRLNMALEDYESLYLRFRSIFNRQGQTFDEYFIPGNHDTGLGTSSSFAPNAHARYVEQFGATNYDISIANHSLVFFDAPGYADEDAKRHGQRKAFKSWTPMKGGSLEYMQRFAAEKHTDPVILFSHIPLYRSDGKSCGPLREYGTLRPGVGHGYQNTLEKQATIRLLEALKPAKVFSGDDHDYCEYTHQLVPAHGPTQVTPETTVKTISMVMNVRRPGFQLLSLYPTTQRTEDTPSYLDIPCLLPDQLRIYLNIYLPLLVISLVAVLVSNLKRRGKSYGHRRPFSQDTQTTFVANGDADDSDRDDAELRPYLNGDIEQSLPSPISVNHKPTSRSRSAGWFVIQGPNERGSPSFSQPLRALWFFWPGKSRTPPHRRGWRHRFMRDVRDIAIFPVGVFIVITWWVVTK